MNNAKKVFIVETSNMYERMFTARGWEITRDLLAADLVQFTGGADVSPYLYGEEKHPTTYNDPRRDLVEAGYYQVCLLLNKPMAGICRGGQFLNVMNGGKLYQNVNYHTIGGTHNAQVFFRKDMMGDKGDFQVTSTHHQMMRVGTGGSCILMANEATKLETDTLTYEGKGLDVEAVWYEKSRSLCYQPHPEVVDKNHDCQELYFHLLNNYIGV